MKTRERADVERYGRRLIKYRRNVAGTAHMIQYELDGLYYTYLMDKGVQVDLNGMQVVPDTVKGTRGMGRYWIEYQESSLNEQQH